MRIRVSRRPLRCPARTAGRAMALTGNVTLTSKGRVGGGRRGLSDAFEVTQAAIDGSDPPGDGGEAQVERQLDGLRALAVERDADLLDPGVDGDVEAAAEHPEARGVS